MLSIALLALLPLTLPNQSGAQTRAVHELPWMGATVVETRLVGADGVVLREARDGAGRRVDLDGLLAAERVARSAGLGKLSPELAAAAAAAAPGELLDVVFWLREPEELDLHGAFQELVAGGATAAEARQAVLQIALATFAPSNQAFAQRLADAGFQVVLVGDYWPDVFARLPAAQLARWAAEPEVDLLYRSFTEGGPEQNNAQGTMRTWNVHDQGLSGATGPTKVLVNDCGEVTQVHPWLPPVIKMTSGSAQSHPSGVAGNIAMNGGGFRAAAYGLPQLYSADGCGSDAPAQAAWSWGLSQGIDLGNCSWWNGSKGQIVFLDRFFDYTIRNYSVMLFKSNGNQGNTSSPYATSPGNGYNMICSGAYSDGNDVNWSNDAMASYSSWWNPVEGHDKPELASPGDGCTSTNTSSGTQNFGGTSSASPLTCGVATLLCNAQPALLAQMPALKAALMAGAWHNIEGAAVLSERDGAGGVHATASHALVRDGQYEAGVFTAASFPGNVYDRQIDLAQGDETRVCALWFSDPDTALTTDLLKMDLDMTVLDPGGQVVASSTHAFNPFEIVQFVPAQSGAYTVRLTLQRFQGTSEPYAIAWSTRQDAAVADVTLAGTPTLGSNLQTTFRSRYDPSVPYVGVISVHTSPQSLPIGSGWVLPLGRDRFALYSLAGNLPGMLTGYTGTLNGSGQASGTFHVPSDPRFLGITFHVAMFTHASGNKSAVRDTSPATSFTIQ